MEHVTEGGRGKIPLQVKELNIICILKKDVLS